LDLAPEAPWRCPDQCPRFERRLADAAWSYGTLVSPPTPPEPPGVGVGEGVGALLDEAEAILNAAGPTILAEVEAERARQQSATGPWWRRAFGRARRPRRRR
ncbi:MAG: hypothetical protein KY447_12540, partial [Actinobacteria bacterium]|nr:hypothetical protein [Actinomycetota bacterium]